MAGQAPTPCAARPVASDSTLCMQIGQVMLALPNAVAVAGMRAAVPLIVVYACLSIYTIHLLTSCYAQLKLRKVCGCRLLLTLPVVALVA